MSENLLQTLQHLIQDVIAPDVRELKVRVSSLERQIDARFESLEARMKLQESLAQARFEAILSAISESKLQSELTAFRAVAPVSERVDILEAKRQ